MIGNQLFSLFLPTKMTKNLSTSKRTEGIISIFSGCYLLAVLSLRTRIRWQVLRNAIGCARSPMVSIRFRGLP
jgi:hypothetical protein